MRSLIYDKLITFTEENYFSLLTRAEDGARILDVGIGTGTPLFSRRNLALVRRKSLTVLGIDIDAAYLARCRKHIALHNIGMHVSCLSMSIYHYSPGSTFDIIYFSDSFPVLPDPVRALKCASALASEDGTIVLHNTIEPRASHVKKAAKWVLNRFSTIDFGRQVTMDLMRDWVDQAGLSIEKQWLMQRTLFGAAAIYETVLS